jgi:hypothetical protein
MLHAGSETGTPVCQVEHAVWSTTHPIHSHTWGATWGACDHADSFDGDYRATAFHNHMLPNDLAYQLLLPIQAARKRVSWAPQMVQCFIYPDPSMDIPGEEVCILLHQAWVSKAHVCKHTRQLVVSISINPADAAAPLMPCHADSMHHMSTDVYH